MATFAWQTWNSGPFTIERKPGKTPGTLILSFHGPCTLRDAYSNLDPQAINKVMSLDAERGEVPISKCILDLTACPYADSSGLGMVVTHHVRCQRRGIKLVVAGMSPRVKQVVHLTKVDTLFPIVETVAEAEGM